MEEINEGDGKGTMKVKDDFELIAFDFVSNPSTHGAFMAPMREGVERNISHPSNKDIRIEAIINDILRDE